ncbi:uncharacterized protein LOC131174664 [Hevea brasiliensis]|uniref:uncharacterized protein LOC131174664 n=1 Tax=Hevea brasiliensis TaxID=3981 RepID=UPI0025D8C0A6|nr:uncharacterized protein LOC131174664 [Hevea brasiliensis]
METKQKQNYMEIIKRRMNFYRAYYVNPIRKARGLALWWRNDVQVQVIKAVKIFIDVHLSLKGNSNSFNATFIYGNPYREERDLLWEDILLLKAVSPEPWLCISDFNVVLLEEEKLGGSQLSASQVRKFQSFISKSNLIDLGYKRLLYTWHNKQFGPTSIQERPDRALGSIEWCELFPKAAILHETLRGSDHRPLILTLECRKVLSNWNYAHFRGTKNEIERLQNRVEEIYADPLNSENNQAKENLQRDDGRWIDSPEEIKTKILSFFKHLYRSSRPSGIQEVIELIPELVSQEMNDQLSAPVTDADVKKVIFDLGASKALGPDGFSGLFYQNNWNVIGPDICNTVKSFFVNGFLCKQLNRTNNQAAFIPNRAIQDNIIIAHEVFEHLRKPKGKKHSMAVKIDMHKAYDQVEWKFFQAILLNFGFS